MLTMNTEKYALDAYRGIANDIVERYVKTLSSYPFQDNNETAKELILLFNKQVKLVNEELALNADKVLAETKPYREVDSKKLKELLFLIRKDSFNDFLKKCELNLQ